MPFQKYKTLIFTKLSKEEITGKWYSDFVFNVETMTVIQDKYGYVEKLINNSHPDLDVMVCDVLNQFTENCPIIFESPFLYYLQQNTETRNGATFGFDSDSKLQEFHNKYKKEVESQFQKQPEKDKYTTVSTQKEFYELLGRNGILPRYNGNITLIQPT